MDEREGGVGPDSGLPGEPFLISVTCRPPCHPLASETPGRSLSVCLS